MFFLLIIFYTISLGAMEQQITSQVQLQDQLENAFLRADVENMQDLIDRGANPNTAAYNPLWFAVVENNIKFAQFLMQRGANMHQKLGFENTLTVLECAHKKNPPMANILLEEKRLFDLREHQQRTCN